jgi:hypothetical protein
MASKITTLHYHYNMALVNNSVFDGPTQLDDSIVDVDADCSEAISPLNLSYPNPLIARPVLHTKSNYVTLYGGSVLFPLEQIPNFSGTVLNKVTDASACYLKLFGHQNAISSTDFPERHWSKAVYEALRSAIPAPPANVSILNTIYELKDFIQMKNTVKGLSDAFRKVGGKRLKHVKSMSTLEALQNLTANPYLAHQFGVKTTLSDIKGIHLAFVQAQKWAEKYKQMLEDPEKVRRSRGSGAGRGDISYEKDPIYSPGLYSNLLYSERLVETTSEVTATVILDYTVNARPLKAAIAGAPPFRNPYWAALGIPKTAWGAAKIVWDTIPFSFVIDYVTDLSGVFDVMEQRLPNAVVPVALELHTKDQVQTCISGEAILSMPYTSVEVKTEFQVCSKDTRYKRSTPTPSSFEEMMHNAGIRSLQLVKTPTQSQRTKLLALLFGSWRE